MQVSIHIPELIQPLFHWMYHIYEFGWNTYQSITLTEWWNQLYAMPYSSVVLPISAILLVFWPLLLSMFMAMLYAWAWIFWIFTSMALGSVQVIYASYQFFMISFDLLILSMLKTYTMLRARALYYFDKTTTFVIASSGNNSNADNKNGTSNQRLIRKSRRRLWREMTDKAGNYENFLKIRIEPKDTSAILKDIEAKRKKTNRNENNNHSSQPHDAALPPPQQNNNNNINNKDSSSPLRRAKSADTLLEGDHDNNNNNNNNNKNTTKATKSPSPPRMKRNFSFSSGDTLLADHEKADPIVVEELGSKIADLLITTTARLKEARLAAMHASKNAMNATDSNVSTTHTPDYLLLEQEETERSLEYLLSAVVKRNHLTLDDFLVENARSVAESGQYGLSNESRQLIRAYYDEVQKGLDWIADAPIPEPIQSSTQSTPQSSNTTSSITSGNNNNNNNNDLAFVVSADLRRQSKLQDRIALVRKMKQNMGRTALMLSGGGAQAMFHLGVIRALIESKLYDDLTVISGTSGGSISAAMCAIKTPEEMYNDVCVSTVSTDYMLNGRMKKENIRWFPPMLDMVKYWMKNRLMVDSKEFQRTCDFYYGDMTFEEGFVRTGKHVCITVSASRAHGNTAQRLMLNHISTPHVTIASAVRASCALPGVMAPAKLMIKNSNGEIEPFEVDGGDWIDGSVQADLPFQRISTLFGVTSFIVSQTNFHIVPFLNKAHHPNQKSVYWRFFQTIEWDIRSRCLKLGRLGLFPKIFGHDVTKMFKQKYHGNLTIVPRFTTKHTLGLQILSNPTVKDMEVYLKYSQVATWPYLNAIRDMIRLEKTLDDCLSRLESQMRNLVPEIDWSNHNPDDLESIASGSAIVNNINNNSSHQHFHRSHSVSSNRSVRIGGRVVNGGGGGGHEPRESERLRKKISGLEHEKQSLLQELERLRKLVGANNPPTTSDESNDHDHDHSSEEKKEIDNENTVSVQDGSEGKIWNIVTKKNV